jgi:uncharacterized protein
MEFSELRIEDKPVFDRFFKDFPPKASEYTFTNMFCWRIPKKHSFAVRDGHLIIRSGIDRFYQPIGPDPSSMIRLILAEFVQASVERIEARALTGLPQARTDRDQWDYVYDVKEMVELPGQRYAAKRNFIKRASKLSPEVCRLDDESVSGLLDLAQRWCMMRECSKDEALSAEDEAVRTALRYHKELGLLGVCVTVDGKVQGFAVGEPLNADTFVEHFEKANPENPGIYQYVLNEFCKALPSQYLYLNREQDLGVEGLRKAKESYHPVRMTEKSIIKP